MALRNLLYLLQLEEYEINRFTSWLARNPGKIVCEKKGSLKWTIKARIIFLVASFLCLFFSPKTALILGLKLLSPFDLIFKKLFVAIAKLKLSFLHRNLIVIGITGSWGKTTLKEKIFKLLEEKYRVEKTEGNNNTLLGISRTIFSLGRNTEILVAEMAAYKKGDIKAICNLVKPKIGIITVIGPMHLERFGTLKTIRETKLEIFEAVDKKGTAIIPEYLQKFVQLSKKKVHFFKAMDEALSIIGGIFGIEKGKVNEIVKSEFAVPHRLQITKKGSITIIDDTYNSNPEGFKKALAVLARIKSSKRIIVTPGMIELGKLQYRENFKVGEKAANIGDEIVIVGKTNREALLKGAKAAKKKVKIYLVDDSEEAKVKLSSIAIPGSAILLENDLPDQYF